MARSQRPAWKLNELYPVVRWIADLSIKTIPPLRTAKQREEIVASVRKLAAQHCLEPNYKARIEPAAFDVGPPRHLIRLRDARADLGISADDATAVGGFA